MKRYMIWLLAVMLGLCLAIIGCDDDDDNDSSSDADADGDTDNSGYTDTEAVAAMGTEAADNPLNHTRYTDAEAVAAPGAAADDNPLNHTRYADAEAVAAMGAGAGDNPLNHTRYADAEAVAAVQGAGAAYPPALLSGGRAVRLAADGTPSANGAALKALVEGYSGLTGTTSVVVVLDPGVYDLGATTITVPSFVDLRGAGMDYTRITGDVANALLTVTPGFCELSHLAIENANAGGRCIHGGVMVQSVFLKATTVWRGANVGQMLVAIDSVLLGNTQPDDNGTVKLRRGTWVGNDGGWGTPINYLCEESVRGESSVLDVNCS